METLAALMIIWKVCQRLANRAAFEGPPFDKYYRWLLICNEIQVRIEEEERRLLAVWADLPPALLAEKIEAVAVGAALPPEEMDNFLAEISAILAEPLAYRRAEPSPEPAERALEEN